MIFAFLSKRLRSWVVFVVVLPLVGRLLQVLGVRVGARNPRAGEALTKAGGFARQPLRKQRAELGRAALARTRTVAARKR